ncbi:MAG: flagellin [Novosphingobium sp.]
MSVINTNIGAMRAANASTSAAAMQGQAMQRLSTGKRINTAKDDAAGLAISTSMTAQINGMNQGIRNANDGISLAQTAEGALNEVTNMLQRIRELAVQSNSGTYQNADRTNMNSEVTALSNQIDSVLANTKFNGNALFSTGASDVTFSIQAGANSGDTITLTSTKFTATNLGSANLKVDTAANAAATLTKVDAALGEVAATNAGLGAGESQLQSAVNNLTSNATNLSDARSRIMDADYSTETTQMAKAQILSQASTAMIAQANQSQQNVLSLLR